MLIADISALAFRWPFLLWREKNYLPFSSRRIGSNSSIPTFSYWSVHIPLNGLYRRSPPAGDIYRFVVSADAVGSNVKDRILTPYHLLLGSRPVDKEYQQTDGYTSVCVMRVNKKGKDGGGGQNNNNKLHFQNKCVADEELHNVLPGDIFGKKGNKIIMGCSFCDDYRTVN